MNEQVTSSELFASPFFEQVMQSLGVAQILTAALSAPEEEKNAFVIVLARALDVERHTLPDGKSIGDYAEELWAESRTLRTTWQQIRQHVSAEEPEREILTAARVNEEEGPP